MPELLSTARPSQLRLAGFLATVVGAAIAGIAATREWAAIGLVQDRAHAADVTINGTDVWEGKAVLLLAALALVLMLAMRVAGSATTRRAIAVLILVLGVACTAIAGVTAVRAQDRFGGTNGVDRLAQAIARQTGDAEDVVRDALLKTLKGEVRVDTGVSVWIAAAGGLLIAVGGALGLAWVLERERERRHDGVPPAPDAV